MATPDTQSRSFSHDSASLGEILTSARDFASQAGAEPKQVDRVEQAVEEAFNISGRDANRSEPILVKFERQPDRICIELGDAGPEYPAEISHAESLESRLLLGFMDEVLFRTDLEGRRAIRMSLKVAAPHESIEGLLIGENIEGKRVIFTLEGRLDSRTTPRFLERLQEALQSEPAEIFFDCKKLEYISSAGVRAWMIAAKHKPQPRVALLAAGPRIQDVLQMAGCLRLFPNFANLNAASMSSKQGL